MSKRPAPVERIELGTLDLTLSHKRKMTELATRREDLALQRRQTELDADRTANAIGRLNERCPGKRGDA